MMTEGHNSIPVVAIADSPETKNQIMTALHNQMEFQLIAIIQKLEVALTEIRAAQPEIIIVDHQIGGRSTYDALDDICMQFPDRCVIALLANQDPRHSQNAVFAGARAFLIQPFTQLDLLNTLRRVYDLESRRRLSQEAAHPETIQQSEPLQTISVFSPRGGVGCSTIATNLAVALREQVNDRILLLEGKLHFGHLGLMLNIRARNTIADLIPHASSLDRSLIEEVVVKHASGIDVLLGPTNIETAQGIRPDDLLSMLRGVRPMYDFIIIDAGSFLDENTVTLMDMSDRVLLVANPDLASLHDVSRFTQISRSLGYPPGKLLVVLNRAGMLGGVNTKDIALALHQPPFAEIPEDGTKAIRSLNRGVPLYFKYPRNPVSRSIRNLAKTLADIGMEENGKARSKSSSSFPEILKKFRASEATP